MTFDNGGIREMIRLDHVTKKFKNGVVALDDLTLSIETGKIYGIVGPNGCGKSVRSSRATTPFLNFFVT